MTNLTDRPILQKTSKPVEEKEKRYAWCVCPNASDFGLKNGRCLPGLRPCPLCNGDGKLKLELIRLAPGSKAKGGARTTKRTTADAKHSLAVRERDDWKCTYCGKDFSDNHGGLQAAHYVKRRYRALRKGFTSHSMECCLRHSVDNALSLCIADHLRLENNLAEHERHFRLWFGDEQCDRLRAEAQKNSGKRVARSS